MTTASLRRPRRFGPRHRHRVLVVVDEPCPSPSLGASVREQAATEAVPGQGGHR
jgi:hypothetical protein